MHRRCFGIGTSFIRSIELAGLQRSRQRAGSVQRIQGFHFTLIRSRTGMDMGMDASVHWCRDVDGYQRIVQFLGRSTLFVHFPIFGSHYHQSFLAWAIIGPIIVSRGLVCFVDPMAESRSENFLGIGYPRGRQHTRLYELLFHVSRPLRRESVRC